MAVLTLALYGLYAVIAFGLRTLLQWRNTGDGGFRGLSGHALSLEWWAGVLFVVAILAGVLAPVLALVGLEPVALLDHRAVALTGVGLAVVGIAATFGAQAQMGSAWRIGVDHDERTELVTAGVFGWVRNPIFTAMLVTGAGLGLMVPNAVALVGWVSLVVAIELQVRVVEEPYLRQLHGARFGRYLATVGRFLPWVGRSRRTRDALPPP